MKRVAAVALLGIAVLLCGGCTTLSAVPNLTDEAAQSETTALVDDVVTAIDPALVERVEQVTDESVACYGTDVDPDQSTRAWQHRRYIYLAEGAQQLDVLNALVAGLDEEKWTIGQDSAYDDTGGRVVQLSTDGDAGQRYGLRLNSSANGTEPRIINVSSNSPCYETD